LINNNNNIENENPYAEKALSHDFICHGCLKHITKEYIENMLAVAKSCQDAGFAISLNQIANVLVSFQRCPDCSIKVLKWWHKRKQKRRKSFFGSGRAAA
jgi:hypothetical protein